MGQVLQPGVHCYFVFVLSMFSGILEQLTSVFMTVVADRTAMAIDMSDATLAKTFDIWKTYDRVWYAGLLIVWTPLIYSGGLDIWKIIEEEVKIFL